jgi:tRNA splicing endonuclease
MTTLDGATDTADKAHSMQTSSSPSSAWEDRIQIVRRHFQAKGYRVHSGLQFGCELVLYADDPSKVHSDFCVHVVPQGEWRVV